MVHDYFSFFEPSQINFSGNLEEKARAAKSWFQFKTRSEITKTNKLIERVTKLAVPSTSVMSYVKERASSPKLTEVLDFAIPNSSEQVLSNDPITISIPGNVIPKSRTYKSVLNAFRKIVDKIDKTELVVLGQAKTNYGRKIIHELEKLQNDKFSLKYYRSFIHQREFDEQIQRSHFLLLPISEVMRYRHFKEKNGFTCVSGNINDMLYFGKPAIIPEFYPLDKEYELMVDRYKDIDHIAEILKQWINEKKYKAIAEQVESVQHTSRQQVINRFKQALR